MPEELDRIRIHELINLHGHLMDEGAFERLGELFVDDVVYDVSAMGGGTLVGIDAVAAAGRALGEANPLGHHVTNIVVDLIGDHTARVRSKGIGVRADGGVGTVVYLDELIRTDRGWRIAVRRVLPRRVPLRPSGSDLSPDA